MQKHLDDSHLKLIMVHFICNLFLFSQNLLFFIQRLHYNSITLLFIKKLYYGIKYVFFIFWGILDVW